MPVRGLLGSVIRGRLGISELLGSVLGSFRDIGCLEARGTQ